MFSVASILDIDDDVRLVERFRARQEVSCFVGRASLRLELLAELVLE